MSTTDEERDAYRARLVASAAEVAAAAPPFSDEQRNLIAANFGGPR